MVTKKIAVYDKHSYFSRFIKYEFRKTHNFDTFKNFKRFEDVSNQYSTIVFVIYKEEELIAFFRILRQGLPMIVCTFNEKLLLELNDIDGILLLDTTKLKAKILVEFRSFINVLDFSYTM